ncbi:double-strand break repair helicase AddA [Yoonia litorea]|uniref:DNA 3'-5' helicase n=1 Tax=Yoonia litorea TaxID=1123755 RepID=A0A1I6MVX7_9RHOB|nr:double-strand break repair helicase AddA [Yoonia litorea]SFS19829.1 DNA helicase/exodeoxyribonuclease V, subunit A [Yoonia litorea]
MIRDEATQRQVDAANPKFSTWLSANAGSGKTRVLTDRVARLLLEDVSPQNILCLTYTKAAATEMQNRLFLRLGQWAMMADEDLRGTLNELGVERQVGPDQLTKARTLFARAIETPGGLKIQTIHSFCAGVLRRFPLEAQVSPQFREMEDRDAELLRAEVVDTLLTGPDAGAVNDMLRHFTGDDLSKLTAEITRNRDAFLQPFKADELRQFLNVPDGASANAFVNEVYDEVLLRDLSDACASGSKSDITLSQNLKALLAAKLDPHRRLAALEGMFLTGKSAKEPYTAKIGKLPTKATRLAQPDLMSRVEDLMTRIEEIRPQRLALRSFERTEALYNFATRFVPAYERRKLMMGALDFDDLIRKARALLTDRDVAQWVLFRLDGGIDHILVDEAQDTSPTQWSVIENLAQEFAAGDGANTGRERTVFVVGDKKQSIYSFQGADPDAFDAMREHFAKAQTDIGKTLFDTSLKHSFRSAQAILSVVDACFTGERAKGMDDSISHLAFKENMPGRVDLWPVVEKPQIEDTREWYKPVDEPSATDHTVVLAERIAAQIGYLIKNESIPEEIGNTGTYNRRKITEGDFLILVQRRSDLFAEIIRACKAANLKIAGADRLRVGAELAVKDLAALLSFLALPEDDLSLAAALRSPLFGWSEQDLFTLAHHRPPKSFLWAALRNSDHNATRAILDDLRSQADFLRPYDLLERILIRHDGRRKLLARLGPEAEDGIDALLAQALAYESGNVPNLTGFLSWMQTDDIEVKRQMESQGDRIRVMTVHGAKGLEAPIVILPDTAKRDVPLRPELLPVGDQVVWKPLADDIPDTLKPIRESILEKERRERMRLLYVAMTRAEKWLIVGAAGDVGDGDASWYNIIQDGMSERGAYEATSGELPITRVSTLDWDVGEVTTPEQKPKTQIVLPEFGHVSAPVTEQTLSPSDLGGAKVLAGEHDTSESDAAKARGTMIHRLLEHLPETPPDRRLTVGLQLAEGQHELVEAISALIENNKLSWLWCSDALTEVDITADIQGLGRIHGAIDRLIVTETTVTAIDYKSNRLVPREASETPAGLLRQMAVYHAALRQIFPDRQVEVAILWTETGELMPIPEAVLGNALGLVTAS